MSDARVGVVPGTLALVPTNLVGLIQRALDRARAVFGDQASFEIEPFLDPEVVEATPCLYLVVRTTLPYEAGIARMDQLDDWWLDHAHEASGRLALTMTFV